MTKPLRVDDEAEQELGEATTWYEQKQPGLGRELLVAIDACLSLIGSAPGAGALVPGVDESLSVRRLLVRKFPYSVVYVELPDEIRVLAFAHARRKPG